MPKNCRKQEVTIAVLQEQIKEVQKSITEIKENHLVHIEDKIKHLDECFDDLKVRVAYYLGAGAVIVILAQFLMNKHL